MPNDNPTKGSSYADVSKHPSGYQKLSDLAQQQGVAPATLGRIIHVTTPNDVDGATRHAAIVSRVNDDGSINAQVFAGGGGSNQHFNGLRHKDEQPADGTADANLPYWEWPPRA